MSNKAASMCSPGNLAKHRLLTSEEDEDVGPLRHPVPKEDVVEAQMSGVQPHRSAVDLHSN